VSEAAFIGKVAVVTGGSSGIGFATAELLAQKGAAVELVDISAERLEESAGKLRRSGAAVRTYPVDVTDEGAVKAAFEKIGRCDVLVNSAGIEGPAGPLEDCDLGAVDRVLAVNVRGGLACAQQAVPLMRHAGGGAIVNLASTAGLLGSRRLGIYALSKSAVISMTRSLALSLAGDNIRVNAVCPGSIDSEMFDRTLASADPEAERRMMISLHPLGRLGKPLEVAEAIAFLASPAAAYITGACLPVDGGRLA
jgi:3-oxoacyl-[acyl-carrier protein] reductase